VAGLLAAALGDRPLRCPLKAGRGRRVPLEAAVQPGQFTFTP
jgi:hypothetical protein